MLLQLIIKNLAIVSEASLEFTQGMNVLTGETGAGKSILLDALNLCLGDRAVANMVRGAQLKAEVTAVFDIRKLTQVQHWLQERDLQHEECIIRRSISHELPTKAYINGQLVTLAELKQLGEMLVSMHGQHQHHALLNGRYQQQLLDQYAGHQDLVQQLQGAYKNWHELLKQYQQLIALEVSADQLEFLNYQIQELETLQLRAGELQELEQQHKKLAKADELLATITAVATNIYDDSGKDVVSQVYNAVHKLQKLIAIAPELEIAKLGLEQAILPLEEVAYELKNFLAKLIIDPSKLRDMEQRLSDIYAIARKHKVAPENLLEHYQNLCARQQQLSNKTLQLQQLQQQIANAEQIYIAIAQQLSNKRQDIARQLTLEITKRLQLLAMPQARFEISVIAQPDKPTLYGIDTVNFLVASNPGQPMQAIAKVASGGELSRISLAIQVILSTKIATPTLIFDEVDVGVSGAVAEIVGKQLRLLGSNSQVICVTHLPQVAAQGHSHYQVTKQQQHDSTNTVITRLNQAQRIQELARLLGGAAISKAAVANAKALLSAAELAILD